mmetsp:Transcript_34182/g.74064  ORF Transcript_34182/g.74064 Transcript_34182/m.74064 type:complete len:94 (-) Transcript_34182:238-519(-)
MQTSRRSYPSTSDALLKRVLAAGTSSQTLAHMPTLCAPCPGKKKATEGFTSAKLPSEGDVGTSTEAADALVRVVLCHIPCQAGEALAGADETW